MTGHVLIIDAVPTTRISLRVKLAAAFYDVQLAASADEAQSKVHRHPPEVLLVGDVGQMRQGTLISQLRAIPALAHVPILAMVPCGTSEARLAALRAGADEVLTVPLCDHVLLAQMRALQRARDTAAELAIRESTQRDLGFAAEGLSEAGRAFAPAARIAVLQPDTLRPDPLISEATERCGHQVSWMAPQALMAGRFDGPDQHAPDAFVLVLDGKRGAEIGQQMLAELRARSATRHSAIIAVLTGDHGEGSATLIDLGANDLVWLDQVSVSEMLWRIERQISQKQQADRLRKTARDGLRAAATDPLTGLFNRRYAMPHLNRLIDGAAKVQRPVAVMMADIDLFKTINDVHGHCVGDAVLKMLGTRLCDQMRAVDLVARLGGEEFLVVMPDTSRAKAMAAAQRLRETIAGHPFVVPSSGVSIDVTISIGIAVRGGRQNAGRTFLSHDQDRAQALLNDADRALYEAKAHGRNTVELFNAAAA